MYKAKNPELSIIILFLLLLLCLVVRASELVWGWEGSLVTITGRYFFHLRLVEWNKEMCTVQENQCGWGTTSKVLELWACGTERERVHALLALFLISWCVNMPSSQKEPERWVEGRGRLPLCRISWKIADSLTYLHSCLYVHVPRESAESLDINLKGWVS